MARFDAYLGVPEYRARIGKEDTGADLLIASDLLAISRLVEENLHVYFNRDAAAVARVFVGDGTQCLKLRGQLDNCPGIAAVTDLAVKVDEDNDGSFADESAWASTDYELHPLNWALGERPADSLYIPGWSAKGVFSSGLRVQVTAIWGYPAVPEVIKALTTMWTKIWRLEGPEGTGRINEMGAVVNMSLDVKRLLDRAESAYGEEVIV